MSVYFSHIRITGAGTRSARMLMCIIAGLCTLAMLAWSPQAAHAESKPDGAGSHADLVSLFDEFLDWRDPPVLTDIRQVTAPAAAALPDYTQAYVAERQAQLEAFQQRLLDMGVTRWDRAEQIDYLVVRAVLDEMEFILHVTQPWARDPNFYVDQLLRPAFTSLPLQDEALAGFTATLRSIPQVFAQAQRNLHAPVGDYADMAIFNLTTEDGVNAGHPARRAIPAGLIGWYEDLAARARAQQPELAPAAEAALQSARDYHAWLLDNREGMTDGAGVGREALDWFLRHVKMLPYDSHDILVLARREMERQRAFLALERHRNRALEEIELPADEAAYLQRLAETDALIRNWMESESIISTPDFIPEDWQEMGYNVPWVEREGPPNFWEQIQYRDPAPDHLHAVIPGHRYDSWVERHNEHPIRGRISFGERREGWALYLEDAALQLGLFESRPRTRELIYIMGLWRAARSYGDVRNQLNDWSGEQAVDWWVKVTPYMDAGVARRYAYLRPSPAHGLHYTIGSLQTYRLLADRYAQLGDDFDLQEFHDDYMSRGRIPHSLIRYEMTGLDDDMSRLWQRTRLSELRR